MSVTSNKYAASVFSEHPIALWPLDDDASFISLISESNRNLLTWTKSSNCTINTSPTLPSTPLPMPDESYSGFYSTVPSVDGELIELISPATFSFDSLNEQMKTFSINLYLYQDSVYVEWYEFGYRYYNDFIGAYVDDVIRVVAPNRKSWIRLNNTFAVEEFDANTAEIIFRASLMTGGSSTSDYQFIMNGLSVGQWSESFSSESVGGTKASVPVSTGLSAYGIPADQYGPLSDNGYYMIDSGKLLARNEGVPLVFGSENVTRLYHQVDGLPSMIFPSRGFLSESGRYKQYTFEFWMRIRPNTKETRRVFGPLDSSNGLYVSEGFITLVIGKTFATHNVSDWYRPMLVHITYGAESIKLFINGELVIEMPINQKSVSLSEKEWVGFYTYSDIDLFEIDVVSVMPYEIQLQVARRRFVWGQGTDSQENIDSSFKGITSSIGFPNANYAVNSIYPDKERWDAAYYNNMSATSRSISVPNYTLPTINIGGRSLDSWYAANKIVNDIEYPLGNHPYFITFRPNMNDDHTAWTISGPDWNEQCYLEFTVANILSAPVAAMYAIFEVESEIAESRPLVHLVNSVTGKRFEININGYNVTYTFDGVDILTVDTSGQEHVVVGFHIPTIVQTYGYQLSEFFSSYESLTMFVGGNGQTTFEGKIYRVGFADASNYGSISEHFDSNGFVAYDDDALFISHYATYTLQPFYRYSTFFLDISVSASFEEHFPLQYFAKYVSDSRGNMYYDLDYLQFNIGYPSIVQRVETTIQNPAWNYEELDFKFSSPIQQSYEILDNSVLSGYDDYAALNDNEITVVSLDTTKSSLDAYITFQLLAEGADEPLSSFPYSKSLTDNFVIDAGAENTNVDPYRAYLTKFQAINGTVIYPPKNISIDKVAMVVHFDIRQDGIISSPLSVRNMEITSNALNNAGVNPVGTRFGNYIYPYTKSGIYYDYKSKNPFLIYKYNTPYLYLTEDSGIKILNTADTNKEYGASILINKIKSRSYSIGAFQLFMKYDLYDIPTVPYPIFEMVYDGGTVEFVVDADASGNRAMIIARDKWSKEIFPLTFYQNGVQVDNPYVSRNQWNVIGVSFNDPISFDSFTGAINLFGGVTFNNVSHYMASGLNEVATIIPRTWDDIYSPDGGTTIYDWQYWYDNNGAGPIRKWKDVYVLAEDQTFSLTPKDICSTYFGTNINVIDDGDGINVSNTDTSVFVNVDWNAPSFVQKPV